MILPSLMMRIDVPAEGREQRLGNSSPIMLANSRTVMRRSPHCRGSALVPQTRLSADSLSLDPGGSQRGPALVRRPAEVSALTSGSTPLQPVFGGTRAGLAAPAFLGSISAGCTGRPA